MQQINRVAIVGGIHGNELTGVYLVKKFEQFPQLIQRSSFETFTLLGNPQAFKLGRRYIDKDLNRCFYSQDLHDPTLSSYEEHRAKTIYQQLKPPGKSPVDLIIDLHSTTANMGLTLILGNTHPFNLQLAAYLSSINPLVRVYNGTQYGQKSAVLRSLCELSFSIEIGPVYQGVLDASFFNKTEELIHVILDYLEAYNQGKVLHRSSAFTLYQYVGTIDYPRNKNGEIQAMIHPQLQGKDYEELNPGEPIFLTFENQVITYEGESTVYPIFINEAAYYEKGIAMCLTEKHQLTIAKREE
ncbi:aspartoacylase [Allocoleopsis franciscana]|uniref:Probable aspartoacylase n=1 Tax=Allocoleopsis franciscana PCC 7113 TaxID=1173027 RepID=K9WL21_9CYAN|nr:aspartoacylase [Allocoleopsis franciscana]AFZ20511.1 succinylglutamate desuccinylase [Allocoleopsis franciscana PCC 7113]